MDAGLDVDEYVLAPQAFDDFVARHQLGAPLDHQDQQVHRLSLEANRASVAPQLVTPDVEREIGEAVRRAGTGRRHGASPPTMS
jgi:hypothetical protein